MLGNPGTLEPKVKELTGKSVVLEKMNRHAVKDGKLGRSSPVVKESKTRTNVDDKQHFSNKPYKSKFSEDPWPPNASCTRPYKKRKLLGEKAGQISDEVGFGFRQDSGVKTVNKSVQVTRNLDPVSTHKVFYSFLRSRDHYPVKFLWYIRMLLRSQYASVFQSTKKKKN